MAITLKAWRINAGLSIKNVADYLGKNRITIYKWENGATVPDKANLKMLAELYNTTVENIFLPCDSTKSRK